MNKKSTKVRNALAAATSVISKKVGMVPITKTSAGQFAHVPTGSLVVDYLIGGTPALDGKPVCPGFPRRRVSEIFGPESSGKTTLALSAVREVQKQGGTAMYLDFEHAIHHGYARQIGVSFDEDKLALYAPDTMEQGFKAVVAGVMAGVDLIVIDSVAAMVPKDEMAKNIDDAAKIGVVAQKMANFLSKLVNWLNTYPAEGSGDSLTKIEDHPGTALLLVNQERAIISAHANEFSDPNTTGGKALKYYTSVRLRISKIGVEKVEKADPLTGKKVSFPYGTKTRIKMIKDKMDGKQGHTGDIFIRYGIGIDDIHSVIETGAATGVVTKEGPMYGYGGTKFKGRDKFRFYLVENPPVYEEVRRKVIATIIASGQVVKDEELVDADIGDLDIDDEDEFSKITQEVAETIEASDAG